MDNVISYRCLPWDTEGEEVICEKRKGGGEGKEMKTQLLAQAL